MNSASFLRPQYANSRRPTDHELPDPLDLQVVPAALRISPAVSSTHDESLSDSAEWHRAAHDVFIDDAFGMPDQEWF